LANVYENFEVSLVTVAMNTLIQCSSQDFSMGILVGVWGRSPLDWIGGLGAKPQPPEAGDLEAKPPAVGGKVIWERKPQRWAIFAIFLLKITHFIYN